jgi:hypothetical protein
MSMANKVAVAANVAIIITCAVLVTMVAIVRGPQLLGSTPAPPYQVGDVFAEAGPETRGKGTLVVVFRSNCVPCRESVAFHRTLAAALKSTGTANVVAVSPEPAEVATAYLREHQVPFTAVKSVSRVRVRSTPSLLWLDANGVIKELWVGRLSPEREAQVYRTLSVSQGAATN